MAYLEACEQKTVVQYLQSAILQLLNDYIPYNETLQVLGVLCVAVDDQVDEVVIKVNSTLKRISSLTPPKERSPDPKNSCTKLKNSAYNSGESPTFVIQKLHETAEASSPLNLGLSVPSKSRGRKQSKPAKVEHSHYVEEELVDENIESIQSHLKEPKNEETGCSRKRRCSFVNAVDEVTNTTYEHPRGISCDDGICVKNEMQSEGPVGLDLSLFSKKHMKQESEVGFALSSNFDDGDEEQVVSTSFLNSAFTQNMPRSSPVETGISKSHFVALLEQTPTFFTHPTSSLYRTIFPACSSDFKVQLASSSFPTNSHSMCDGFELKNEEDYLLDCLNTDGKKRRRRSLEDALTSDEMLEYMGSQDKSEASFPCHICGEITADLLKYFHHTLSCHKAFICHQCGRCFTTKSSLLRHRPIHTGLRRFACGICHKAFYRKDKCKAHIKKHAEVQEDQDAAFNLQVL